MSGDRKIYVNNMELRDFFAGCALIGLLRTERTERPTSPENIVNAERCYRIADDMLKEREKKETP